MSAGTTVSALLKSTTHGPAWHGPALMELLNDVSASDAFAHPVDGVHSIWEIVAHINLWQRYTLATLKGDDVSFLDEKDDWPKPSGKNDDWERVCRQAEGLSREIRELAVHLDNEQLKAIVPDGDYNVKVLLHGVVAHNVYHAGQIALLKKVLKQETGTQLKAVGE